MKITTALISLLFIPVLVFAQNGASLPSAGLTPESPLYFIDTLGEALQDFFTFNPEGKARLQITFAAERVAEIKIILETKGVDAKGLEVAQSRLQAHLANAATIVVEQKSKGKDVSTLAKELDDELETPKSALADSFKAEKRVLEAKEDELKAQLKAAHRAGDTVKEEALAQELGHIKAQLELLELKEEDIENDLEDEEEKLEEQMEAKIKAEKAIREAEEEKQGVIDEAVEEDAELPASAFAEFDSLLAQAKSTLHAGNFIEAKNFAKRAEKSLDQIEKTIEELEKKQEKKAEAEEAIKEAEAEKQEVLAGIVVMDGSGGDDVTGIVVMDGSGGDDVTGIVVMDGSGGDDIFDINSSILLKFDKLLAQAKELFAKENYVGAKQLAEQAEDALEDVDKEIEKFEKSLDDARDKERERKEEQAKATEERKREQEEKRPDGSDEDGGPELYDEDIPTRQE